MTKTIVGLIAAVLVLSALVGVLAIRLDRMDWAINARINAVEAAEEVLIVDYNDFDLRIANLEGADRTDYSEPEELLAGR